MAAGAELIANLEAALAVGLVILLAFELWLWRRARPGSIDAFYIGISAGLASAMLLNTVPGVLWPEASSIRIAGLVAGVILMSAVIIALVRRRRAASTPGH